jgi:hypothetical protein
MVDPDFVPDYSGNQANYPLHYTNPQKEHDSHDSGWCADEYNIDVYNNTGPVVSTKEKREEAAALLKEWGIE